VLIVAAFIASLKVAVIICAVGTPVALLAGAVETTVGTALLTVCSRPHPARKTPSRSAIPKSFGTTTYSLYVSSFALLFNFLTGVPSLVSGGAANRCRQILVGRLKLTKFPPPQCALWRGWPRVTRISRSGTTSKMRVLDLVCGWWNAHFLLTLYRSVHNSYQPGEILEVVAQTTFRSKRDAGRRPFIPISNSAYPIWELLNRYTHPLSRLASACTRPILAI